MVYNVYRVNLYQPLLENHFVRLQRVNLMLGTCDVLKRSLCVIHLPIFGINMCKFPELTSRT